MLTDFLVEKFFDVQNIGTFRYIEQGDVFWLIRNGSDDVERGNDGANYNRGLT